MNSDEIMIDWQESQQTTQQNPSLETSTTTSESKAQGSKQISAVSGNATSTFATTTTHENAAATNLTKTPQSTFASKTNARTTTTITSTSGLMRQNENIMTSNLNNNNNDDNSKHSTMNEEKSVISDVDHQQQSSSNNSPKSSCGDSKNLLNNPDNAASSHHDDTDLRIKNSVFSNDDSLKGEFSNITPASSPDEHERVLMIANDDHGDQIDSESNSRSPSSSSAVPSPSTTNSTNNIGSQLKTAINSSLAASSSGDNKSKFTADANACSESNNSERLSSTINEPQVDSIASVSTAREISVDTSSMMKVELKVTTGDLSMNSDSTITPVSPHASEQQQDTDMTTKGCTLTSPISSNSNDILATDATLTPVNGAGSGSSINTNNSQENSLVIESRDSENTAELRWMPGIPDCDLMMYLRAARSMAAFAGMCDGGTLSTDDFNPATRDDTTINALELLHNCSYDIIKALQALVKNPIPRSVDKKWSSDEQQRFIRAVNTRYPPKGEKKDKDFIRIRNEVLPHKKVSELVEFYYLFKKTSLFTGPKNHRKRRVAPSKLKPTKNLNNRENNLEVGECASSDESVDGINENEENGKKMQNHDPSCLLENASNSPSSGDQIAEANAEPDVSPSSNIDANAYDPNKSKHKPRSPSIMQKSNKSEDMTNKQDHLHRLEYRGQTKVESSVKNEEGTSSSVTITKMFKEEESGTGYSTSPDSSPRASPQRISMPEEKLPRPSPYSGQSVASNDQFLSKPGCESDVSMPDHRGDSPNQSVSKPTNLSALPTGCSSLAQFTDSIGGPPPTAQRASPNFNRQAHQSSSNQTSCASLAQLTERIGQPSPNNTSNAFNVRPTQSLPSNLSPGLGQMPGLPSLPPNMPYNLPYNIPYYGQPPRPGQPPMQLPPMFPGIPGFPGFPIPPVNTLNPTNSSPAKIPTPKSSSGQPKSAPSTSSPVGSHVQQAGPILSPHQQSSSLASPSAHTNPSPNKIRTQNAILTRVIQRPDNITCARTDWTFKPAKTDVEWYRRIQRRRSERDHSEPKKMATDRDIHHGAAQHQQHSHSQQQHHQQPPMSHQNAPQQTLSNFMPQHQIQSRERDPPGPPPGPTLPGLSDSSHLLHPFPSAGSIDRPQSSRYLDNPPLGPFGFRNSPGDLTRPHTAFSPAGFPPRGTPTSLPSSTPSFLQGPGFPPIPASALEAIFMQYHLYNERLANAGGLDFDSQRRLFQHPGYPDATAGPPGSSTGLPPPMLHNPASPNPAALTGLIFPPGSDSRDQFNERLTQPDAFRLPMRPAPDIYQAYAAALSHLGNAHDPPGGSGGQGSGPGGPGGLGLPPPPLHSQADGIGFPGAPGVRPMVPGRDQYFNPQRYASYGSPYGVPPSPFFGLGGPPAP